MVEASGKRRLATAAIPSSAALAAVEAHAPLLDAIAENPDDPGPWTVYADLLQTTEHPRGELISLMMERERRPSLRLFELQRRQLAAHGPTLLPTALEHVVAVGWRRGFVNEVRLAAPEQVAAVQRDLSLRFVEAATLVIDVESWTEWCAALRGATLPWRRLRIELVNTGDELAMAPILAGTPEIVTLHVECAADADGALGWAEARGDKLERLTLVNAGEVSSLDEAELPRLEELRLLGTSTPGDDLRTSLRWSRLSRVVLAEGSSEEETRLESDVGPTVRVSAPVAGTPPEPEDEYTDPPDLTTAFVVIGQPIPPALVHKLAARMTIAHLSARIVSVRWLLQPVTVIQLFGSNEADLLPYGLALALENVLDPAPRIGLVEIDADRAARYLVLGDTQTRGTQHSQPHEVVRRALDLTLGYDPGSTILQDLLVELGAAPIERLLGDGSTEQLAMIDPSSAPLVLPDEGTTDDDEDDEDEYGESDDWDYDMGESAEYEEPVLVADDEEEDEPPAPPTRPPAPALTAAVPIAPTVIVTDDRVDESADDPVHEDDAFDDEPLPIADTEDALVAPPQRSELWVEFREHWDDRAIAVDDEASETRWPDPEYGEERASDLDAQVAEPTCVRHVRTLVDCKWCDTLHCPECGGEDWCSTCFAAAAGLATIEDPLLRT